ncbi:dnaJ homolog subfamily B member 9-like [Acanthochromis polyacanthus]|uniref:dnaJ homolog subfamily B member 9-like n=1 Tax=Acanthochromis polyacanthus TaxID=80966 RepID=UPI000B8FAEE1|nr:dnaJ homolog subfamily B member 9-like [Acanthochromis polyacanthus]
MAALGAFHWMQTCMILLLCLSEPLPAASQNNYYETLNVEPTATDSQIKKSFRKLAMKYHPDKNKSTDAEKTFREIAEAYTVLSNKDKRKLYDSVGHEAFLNNDPDDEQEMSFSFSFSDFFSDFDDGPFVDELHFHWSFDHGVADEDGQYEHYSFEDPEFSFYFGDLDENEDVYLY